jgi:sec-independent protein translocase protein TatA
MLPNLGVMELLIISGVVVLLFGAKKLPQLGGAIGESIKNFKKGVRDDEETKKIPDPNDIKNP